MPAEVNPIVVGLDDFVTSMTRSLINATEAVYAMSSPRSPQVYVVPEMSVTVNMSFTYEQGKVKGILNRTKSTETQQVDSTIAFKIVAIPRNPRQESPSPQIAGRTSPERSNADARPTG